MMRKTSGSEFVFGILAGSSVMMVVAIAAFDMHRSLIQKEAVQRGFAEWVASEPGGKPDTFQWKEGDDE